MEFKEFIKGKVLFDRTFPNIKISQTTWEMWHKLLEEFTYDQYQDGLLFVLKTTPQWYPSDNLAGKIRHAIKGDESYGIYQLLNQTKKNKEIGNG